MSHLPADPNARAAEAEQRIVGLAATDTPEMQAIDKLRNLLKEFWPQLPFGAAWLSAWMHDADDILCNRYWDARAAARDAA